MPMSTTGSTLPWPGRVLAYVLLVILVLPLVALALSSSPSDVAAGLGHPLFAPALWLSLRTTLVSLSVVLVSGTPLAWWLASSRSRAAHVVALLVDLPIVMPPAVLGIALLQAYGRHGVLGPLLERFGVTLPFSTTAVVLAQIVVSAPFYVQAAASAFRELDPDLLVVARTLGATPQAAFRKVALPLTLPALASGAALAWARSLGEFGATLLFAGSSTGVTQTMPVAIYTALESDVRAALALALVLAGFAAVLLALVRAAPRALGGTRTTSARAFPELRA